MKIKAAIIIALVLLFSAAYAEADVRPNKRSFKTKECAKCHKEKTPVIIQQWGASKHYRANVGCYECHQASKNDPDVIEHYDELIYVLVSPKDCARCNEKESSDFNA